MQYVLDLFLSIGETVFMDVIPDLPGGRPLKGRGAVANPTGRYERHRRVRVDDGWGADGGAEGGEFAAPARRTRVAVDQLTLNAAQVDLDALLSSHPVATAQLESAVAEGRIALDAARETFAEITTPDKGDLAAARSRLDDARKALDDLLDPESIEFARAQRKVALALVELDDARDDFDGAEDGFTS